MSARRRAWKRKVSRAVVIRRIEPGVSAPVAKGVVPIEGVGF